MLADCGLRCGSPTPCDGTQLRKILELRRFTEANAATLGSQMLAPWLHSRVVADLEVETLSLKYV